MLNDIVAISGGAFRTGAWSSIWYIVTQHHDQTFSYGTWVVNAARRVVEFLIHQIERPRNF